MPGQYRRKRRRPRRMDAVAKPRGTIHPRVQKVGPEHFGIVSVDCAKARSKWMLCDEHQRPAFQQAVTRVREAMNDRTVWHGLPARDSTGWKPVPQAATTIRCGGPLPPVAWRFALSTPSPPNNIVSPAIRATRRMTPTCRRSTAAPIAVVSPSLQEAGAALEGGRQRPEGDTREGGLALLPHRLSDGGRTAGLPPSVHSGTQLHPA